MAYGGTRSKAATPEYRAGWDATFGKPTLAKGSPRKGGKGQKQTTRHPKKGAARRK